ncbi:MAG: hypothetical protein ABI670_09670 [Chloroflexota bacterium]
MILNECYDEGLLRSYLDDTLPHAEQTEIGVHLTTCLACRVRLRGLKALTRQASSLLAMHATVPDPHLALARLQDTTRSNGMMSGASSKKRATGLPTPTIREVAETTGTTWPHSRMRFALTGVCMAIAIVLALGLSTLFASQRSLTVQNSGAIEPLVPPGKVRHFIVTSTIPRTPPELEVWLENGSKHLLVRTLDKATGSWKLVGDESVWTHSPDSLSSSRYKLDNAVYKTPYDPRHLYDFVADQAYVDDFLMQPNTKAVTGEKLDGRDVLILESSSNASGYISRVLPMAGTTPLVGFPQFPGKTIQVSGWQPSNPDYDSVTGTVLPVPSVTPQIAISPLDANGLSDTLADYRIWIDKQNYQVVRKEAIYHYPNGTVNSTYVVQIIKDELLNVVDLPSDLFTFNLPLGLQLINADSSFYRPYTSLSSPAGNPILGQPGWFLLTPAGGRFSIQFPAQVAEVSGRSGWWIYTAKKGDIIYGASYQEIGYTPPDQAKRDYVDQKFSTAIRTLSLQASVGNMKSISLGAYVGKEAQVNLSDGTFGRLRVYLAGDRLYSIYAIAPDEKILASQEVDGYLNSFKPLMP